MSDPTTIANLLQSTLMGTTESIRKTEQVLQQMQKDRSFLSNLLIVVREQNLEKNIRKAAALYTKKYVKFRLLEMDQSKLNQTAESLLNQLSVVSNDISLRKYIAGSLEYLLMNDSKFVIREILNPHCIKLMEDSKNQSDAEVNYQFLGFFAQTLMSSFSSLTRDLNVFMQKTIEAFCQLSLRVFKYVAETIQSQDKSKIVHIFRILKLYSYTLKIYLRKMMLAQIQTIKLLYSETLQRLISTSLAFTLSNNLLSVPVIFFNPKSDPQIVQLFHSIKSDYVQSITYVMRAIFLQFKQKQMQAANPILKNPALVPSFIYALSQLFNQVPYYKIKSVATMRLVEQVIGCLVIAVRNVMYFNVFVEYKKQIVQDCVIKVLQFSQVDVDKFYEDPEDFINELLQIIELQSSQYLKNKDKQTISFQTNNQQIQQYTNLRTLASALLTSFCKHIDSSLPQILSFSSTVLKQTETSSSGSQFPKSTLLLMLCILRDQIIERQNASCQILSIVCGLLGSRKLPLKVGDPDNTPLGVYQDNMEYLIIMLTVYRFISLTPEIKEEQLKIVYEVVYAVLSGEHEVSDAIQYAGFDLVMGLCEREQKFQTRFIQVLNQLLLVQKTNKVKCLQTLIALFNNPSKSLKQNPQIVTLTIQNLCKIVYVQSQKKAGINQLLVNHCWNVISSVCQNDKFIPKLIPEIEQSVMPLLQFIDGKQNLDYEEDIFMMMSSFIGKAKTVTQNELVMFEIIPKLFYSQYQFMFGHAFETLHIFILYGSEILASAPQAIKAIVDMAITCMNTTKVKDKQRNESQNCEGVIILQSLIMSCGNSFTTELWVDIVKFLTSRLENPPVKTHILHSNILATIALSLTLTYKFFSNDDCEILLNRVLQNYYCFVVQYSIKVVIVAFSQLLALNNLPFVANRFTMLLDATITLLQGYQKKDIFNKNPITMQEKDYDISLQTLKNMVTEIDEIEHLKKNILRVKQQNPGLLQKAIGQLPQGRAEYLKQLVNSTKVNNQARPIFKIKK